MPLQEGSEAVAGGSQVPAQQGQLSETLSRKRKRPGDIIQHEDPEFNPRYHTYTPIPKGK